MLKDILKEFRKDGKRDHLIAADLAELADKHGITIGGVARFPDILKKKKLKPADVTSSVLAIASAIERMDRNQTELHLQQINESRKPQIKASPLVKVIYASFMSVGANFTLKGAVKAKCHLAKHGIDPEDVTEELLSKVQTYYDQMMGMG